MSEYISREKLNDLLDKFTVMNGLYNAIETIPTENVAPVVFCRDCVNHGCCSVEDTMSFARLSEDRCFCGVGKSLEINGGDKND